MWPSLLHIFLLLIFHYIIYTSDKSHLWINELLIITNRQIQFQVISIKRRMNINNKCRLVMRLGNQSSSWLIISLPLFEHHQLNMLSVNIVTVNSTGQRR